MVYGDQSTVNKFSALVNEFPTLWQDHGFVNVPEDERMKITLRDDWQSRVSGKAKIYPLGLRDKEVVNKTFNKLHEQGRLVWTNQSTPFSYPVFVVWKTLANGERKGRPVVDIRALNDLIVPDAYPLPLQSDVIASLQGCRYISVCDAASFFYQWRTHKDSRHLFTVVSHRGQETFQVPVMGCMTSVAYVQRQIDKILRALHRSRAYVDDIVTGGVTLDQHLADMRELFATLVKWNVSLAPAKTFLGYPDVQLLGQRVNSLGLTTATEKLAAIAKIQYPLTVGDLEHFLGLTGYLRSYVHYYAQLARPLQDLKTQQLKLAPVKGNPRKAYVSKTKLPLPPSPTEEASFTGLKQALSSPAILIHFSPDRVLWIDLDASKEFGFGVVIFHVKTDVQERLPVGK